MGSSTEWICAHQRDLVYYRLSQGLNVCHSTISSHGKNTSTKACIQAGCPAAFHYENLLQQLPMRTKYSLSRQRQNQFLTECVFWALTRKEERMVSGKEGMIITEFWSWEGEVEEKVQWGNAGWQQRTGLSKIRGYLTDFCTPAVWAEWWKIDPLISSCGGNSFASNFMANKKKIQGNNTRSAQEL